MSQLKEWGLECLSIKSGQIRTDDFVHNGGWYECDGTKIGWGDLSREDLQRIPRCLPEGEPLIILDEHYSFWSFVRRPGLLGSMTQVRQEEHAPGIEYVADKCCYILTRGHRYYVARNWSNQREEITVHGITFEVLDRQGARNLILAHQSSFALDET